MNDLMTIDGFQIPDYVKNEAPVNEDFGSAGGLPKIRIRRNMTTFDLVKGIEVVSVPAPIPVIILGISPKKKALSRAYYLKTWVDGSTEAPDCASSTGVFPDSGDQKQHTDCATCPLSQFGSAANGKAQACTQSKIVYAVPANDINGDIYQLRVPPMSLKALATYGSNLSKHKIDKAAAITHIGYQSDDGSDVPKLAFSLTGFLSAEQALTSIERSQSPEIAALIVDTLIDTLPAPPPVVAPVQPVSQPTQAPTPAQPAVAPATPVQAPAPAQPVPQTAVAPAAPVQTLGTTPNPLGPDSAGQYWDPAIHSSGQTKIANGTWKKRKGLKEEAQPQPAQTSTQPPPALPAAPQITTSNELDAALLPFSQLT